jgi:hypothetical protein
MISSKRMIFDSNVESRRPQPGLDLVAAQGKTGAQLAVAPHLRLA